jgi:prevent-host-death family protein
MAIDEATIPEPVTVSELRADLRRILETAHYFGRRYVILRNGDAVAVLMGLEDFRQLVGAPGAPAEINRK